MTSIKLGKKKIDEFSKPYIIAEVGVNHECSLLKAKKLVFLAKKGGADAVKFQTYKAAKIASKNSPSYWDTKKEKTKNQFQLFKKFDKFERSDYVKIKKYCVKLNIEFCSTPFDHDSVDLLNPLVNFYKISSSDITNFPLIKKISKKKKPILLSTGGSTLNEINSALSLIKKTSNSKVVLMHCILNYPTKNSDANLRMIKSLKKEFPNNIIGYSDHTLPCKDMLNLCTAYSMGAIVIEKHFTDNKKKKGNDHYHAMDYKDLSKFMLNSKKIFDVIGKYKKKTFIKSELISRRNARRSIVLNDYVKKGQKIKKNNIICKRPGNGISPVFFDKIIGKKFKKNIPADSILYWKNIE